MKRQVKVSKESYRAEFEDLLRSDPHFSQVYGADEFDEWYEDYIE
jgi:hypothetical protein